jgi:hypothetical protein
MGVTMTSFIHNKAGPIEVTKSLKSFYYGLSPCFYKKILPTRPNVILTGFGVFDYEHDSDIFFQII